MSKMVTVFKNKKFLIIILVAVLVCGGILGGSLIKGKSKKATSDNIIGTSFVTRGDIEVAITGSASVEPYERYEIISMVSGDIISSPYDVGDIVTEGNILYQFDTSSAQTNIKKQELSLEQSKNNLNNAKADLATAQSKLSITAKSSGIISGLSLKLGGSVLNNENIATITNTTDLEVTVGFTKEQTQNMYIGAPATISSSTHMSTVSGSVLSVSSSPQAQPDGSNLYSVTIGFKNPGAFSEGLKVGAKVFDMASPSYGVIEYTESSNIKAEASGTISSINYNNGDYVPYGAVIATISSDDLTSQQRSVTNSELSLKNAELSMQETKDSLDDYSIKAPISGTVITKNAKAGDTIDRTNSSTALMVIADISKLKFNIEIDELDVKNVKEGQTVSITCEALPQDKFEGFISSVSVEGVATNGVTTYSAEVIIPNPKNLRPSMNVDASIIINSAENVLMVPSSDVKSAMGVSYVFQKQSEEVFASTEEDFENAINNHLKADTDGVENDGDMPFTPPKSQRMPSSKENNKKASILPEAPEGFVVKIVETGLSNDEYIEIKSGLSEFDEILQITVNSSSQGNFMMPMGQMSGGMPQGMMGGGMPQGGGDMPSGGMR